LPQKRENRVLMLGGAVAFFEERLGPAANGSR